MLADLAIELLKLLLIIAAIYTALTYLFKRYSDFGLIRAQWHQPFDFQFSVQEFYTSIEQLLKAQEIKGLEISRKTHAEDGMFSPNREYLRIVYGEDMFLICAAPYGKGMFVSWRAGEWMNVFKDLIPRIPSIGPQLARAMFHRSYYQLDTAAMFSDTIRKAVNEAIDQLTNTQGIRPMTELERMPRYSDSPFQSVKL